MGSEHSINNIDNSNSAILSISNSEVTNSGISSIMLQQQASSTSGGGGGGGGDPNMSLNFEDENNEFYS